MYSDSEIADEINSIKWVQSVQRNVPIYIETLKFSVKIT